MTKFDQRWMTDTSSTLVTNDPMLHVNKLVRHVLMSKVYNAVFFIVVCTNLCRLMLRLDYFATQF